MKRGTVVSLVGLVVAAIGLLMLAPAAVGVVEGEREGWVVAATAPAVALVGLAMFRAFPRGEITRREAYAVVGIGWLAAAAAAALPFLTTRAIPDPVDAVFEAVSGLTTTGATILPRVDELARCVQVWRCQTQWIGGFGILLMVIVFVPFLEPSGARILRSETGLLSERVRPRLRETGWVLAKVYFLFTALQAVLLRLAGLSWFDAVCHAMTTMPTGGFSPHTANAGALTTAARAIIFVFMLIAATNFALHARLFQGDWRAYLRDAQFRAYPVVILGAAAVVAADLWVGGAQRGGEAVFSALFHTVSFGTTTGYTAADVGSWPPLSRLVLVLCMFSFGMSGSTTGGLKLWRLLLMVKVLGREVGSLFYPDRVLKVKMGGEIVEERALRRAGGFVVAYLLLLATTALVLAAFGRDFVTAFSGAASCLGNVGPAFGLLSSHYGAVTSFEKVWLALVMLVGRLEIFGFIMIFSPAMWRRSLA